MEAETAPAPILNQFSLCQMRGFLLPKLLLLTAGIWGKLSPQGQLRVLVPDVAVLLHFLPFGHEG